VTLCSIAQPVAVRYLLSVLDGLEAVDELMQMAVIELVRLEAKTEGANRVSGTVGEWLRTSLTGMFVVAGPLDSMHLQSAQLAEPRCEIRGRDNFDRSDPKPSSSQG
jgi:hypothetical protein